MKRRQEPKDDRKAALQLLAERTRGLRWSSKLVTLLLEELGEEDDLEDLVGRIEDLLPRQYPHAVALAVALRYSWRRDEFRRMARRIQTLAAQKVPGKSP